jgi:NADPH2:quinone reductase
MKRIVAREHGGPQVMKIEEVEAGNPGPNEIKVRNHAIGVNYTDIYTRQGNETYLRSSAHQVEPYTPGKEGAGIVVQIGEGVKHFKPGDRVVYIQSLGAYGEEHIVRANLALPLPEELSFQKAASSTLRGLTAHFLTHYTYPVKAGEIAMVHAATGGVGSVLTQWIKSKGATVIGTVDSDDKKERAKELGADLVINTLTEDIAGKVAEFTKGKRCHVVYDGLGKAVTEASLNSLRNFGYYVNFGMITGAVSLDLWDLAAHGSLYATFPDLDHYVDDYDQLLSMANDFFAAIIDGTIKIGDPVKFPLEEAPKAHGLLESAKRIDLIVLAP